MKPPRTVVALLFTIAATAAAGGRPAAAQGPPPPLYPAGYPGFAALSTALEKVAAEHPDRVRLRSIGQSVQGREIWLVTLGKSVKESAPARRPAVLLVANLEADHVVGSVVALGLIERLAAATGKAAAWLDRCDVHVVPRLDPDGVERALSAPLADFRLNLRPVDRDRDGRAGEDGPDDLDADGLIVTMRLKDPRRATLVPHDKDPRLLRPADPARGEAPVYAEESEGLDDDADGLRGEDPPGGVNLNRNWPHRWTEFDPEAGFSPTSEPEVHALIAFAFEHPEIAAVWSFGLGDNLREEPKKPGSDLDAADLPLVAELSRVYQKTTAAPAVAAGGSQAGKGTPAPGATTDGSLAAWAYHQFGALGLASRLWTTPEIPPPPTPAPAPAPAPATAKEQPGAAPTPARPAVPDDGELRWLYWNDHVVGGRAFVPFHPFNHPALGPVEIGGWRPGVRLNPPMAQVGPITEAHLAFLEELTGRLARLAVPEVKVQAKGGRTFEIEALVRNDGYLPTALAQGVRTRKAPPVLVRLELAGATVLAGRPREQLDTLAGSGGRQTFRWLILAPEALRETRLEVTCPRAGTVVVPVRLESK